MTAPRGSRPAPDRRPARTSETDRRRTRRPKALRTACATLPLLVLALLASGCGIRATSVPVDAGPAPSRVGCAPPTSTPVAPQEGTSRVRIFLVCGPRVAPLERNVRIPDERSATRREPVAKALLAQLTEHPSQAERTTGFESAVPEDLSIKSGTDDDPKEALRLSMPLAELPSFALAQIVCTLSDSAAADANDTVVLGGPAEDTEADDAESSLERFECSTALRTRPEAAETAGTEV